MYDCENRLEAARHFLESSQKMDIDDDRKKWYIQASVSFAIAASEVIAYDYAQFAGLQVDDSKLDLWGFRTSFPNEKFYPWLSERLGVHNRQKSSDVIRYSFLRNERNRILHRGEPDKKAIRMSQPPGSDAASVSALYFRNWDFESCDVACEKTIEFVGNIVRDAKYSGYL
jgi:hypothetical protein